MKTTKPTAKKLPKPGLRYASPAGSDVLFSDKCLIWSVPAAVIPSHTSAQARRIVKAAPFLQLSEEEKVEALARSILEHGERETLPSERFDYDRLQESDKSYYRDMARAVLSAMNMGGEKP